MSGLPRITLSGCAITINSDVRTLECVWVFLQRWASDQFSVACCCKIFTISIAVMLLVLLLIICFIFYCSGFFFLFLWAVEQVDYLVTDLY
jgi:hypothetical protein